MQSISLVLNRRCIRVECKLLDQLSIHGRKILSAQHHAEGWIPGWIDYNVNDPEFFHSQKQKNSLKNCRKKSRLFMEISDSIHFISNTYDEGTSPINVAKTLPASNTCQATREIAMRIVA